jgi:hypothetical protein
MKVEIIDSKNYYKKIEYQNIYKAVDSAFGNVINDNYVIIDKEKGGNLMVVIINEEVFWRNFAEVLEEEFEVDASKLLTWRAKDAILYSNSSDRFMFSGMSGIPFNSKLSSTYVGHWSSATKTLVAFRIGSDDEDSYS